jgi:hypothetical protein
MENPTMKMLRDEPISTACRLEIPTATIVPARLRQILCSTAANLLLLLPYVENYILTKENEEDAAYDGVRDGDKQCTKFSAHATNEHQ